MLVNISPLARNRMAALAKTRYARKRFMARRLVHITCLLLLPATVLSQQARIPGTAELQREEQAEVRRYAVELIVFEYTDSSSAGSEEFLPDPLPEQYPPNDFTGEDAALDRQGLPIDAMADMTSAADAATTSAEGTTPEDELLEIPTLGRVDFRPLPQSEFLLQDVYDKLVRVDAYRPILHTAWTQLTYEKADTLPIDLRRLANTPLRLNGKITLYISRFLHLVVDVSIEEKSPLRGPLAEPRIRRLEEGRSSDRPLPAGRTTPRFDPEFLTPTVHYRINEDRIVRNDDVRYYDHPRFGVIAKITRVEAATTDGAGTAPGTLN